MTALGSSAPRDFGGNVQSFFDKHGDQIFYGSKLLGTLTSIFAAGWKYMTKGEHKPEDRPLMRLYALTDQIRKADSEAELAEAERCIDDILKGELQRYAIGDAEATETAAMGLATHRLEHLIAQRRMALNGKPASTLQPHQASTQGQCGDHSEF